jgi:hypothetical protein
LAEPTKRGMGAGRGGSQMWLGIKREWRLLQPWCDPWGLGIYQKIRRVACTSLLTPLLRAASCTGPAAQCTHICPPTACGDSDRTLVGRLRPRASLFKLVSPLLRFESSQLTCSGIHCLNEVLFKFILRSCALCAELCCSAWPLIQHLLRLHAKLYLIQRPVDNLLTQKIRCSRQLWLNLLG